MSGKLMVVKFSSGVIKGGEGWTAPGDTLQRGYTRPKIIFSWLNLERTLQETTAKNAITFRGDD